LSACSLAGRLLGRPARPTIEGAASSSGISIRELYGAWRAGLAFRQGQQEYVVDGAIFVEIDLA
jgi:hypothetical protein